jgi:hypothetical protein
MRGSFLSHTHAQEQCVSTTTGTTKASVQGICAKRCTVDHTAPSPSSQRWDRWHLRQPQIPPHPLDSHTGATTAQIQHLKQRTMRLLLGNPNQPHSLFQAHARRLQPSTKSRGTEGGMKRGKHGGGRASSNHPRTCAALKRVTQWQNPGHTKPTDTPWQSAAGIKGALPMDNSRAATFFLGGC